MVLNQNTTYVCVAECEYHIGILGSNLPQKDINGQNEQNGC